MLEISEERDRSIISLSLCLLPLPVPPLYMFLLKELFVHLHVCSGAV